MAHIALTEKNFEQEVLQSKQTVVVDFFATWCGPCKMLAPILEELSEERKDVKFCQVDVDRASELAARFHIVSVPTLLVFQNGQQTHKSVGYAEKEAITALL